MKKIPALSIIKEGFLHFIRLREMYKKQDLIQKNTRID